MTTTWAASGPGTALWVRVDGDFNDLELAYSGFRRMPLTVDYWRPAIGDKVLVYDDDGNECKGTVSELARWGCYALMDMATWTDGPPFDDAPTLDVQNHIGDD